MNADEVLRIRQGASATTSPEVLRALATDPSVTVRASLALNPALPDQVSAILAADTDARVRSILNRRLAKLTPTLPAEAQQRVQQDAVATLTAMVADAALRVRINLAQSVKDLPEGARDIVLRLAYDPEVMVCEPVIRFSPLLAQEDLVALIAAGPPPTTLMAVANRPAINESVSDAIVSTADPAVIAALLGNTSAQIREATLDSLAAQSEEQADWQAPLVRRPRLSARAQRLLAEIVTGQLLANLAARKDLDPKVAQMVRAAVALDRPASPAKPAAGSAQQSAVAHADALIKAGKVDDDAIVQALRRSASQAAAAMLAAKAAMPLSVIERACALRSAKGIVSLAWKAGLSVQTAVILQAALAHLPPTMILRPGRDGAYPLSEDEMRWQLAFLDIPDGQPRRWTPRRLSQ